MTLCTRAKTRRCINTIWRVYKAHKHNIPHNTVDMITLEIIRYGDKGRPVFKYVASNGIVTAFDAKALVGFFMATGNLIHPGTRHPFLTPELRRLQKLNDTNINLVLEQERLLKLHKDSLIHESLVEFLQQSLMYETTTAFEMCSVLIPSQVCVAMLYNRLLPTLQEHVVALLTYAGFASTNSFLENVLFTMRGGEAAHPQLVHIIHSFCAVLYRALAKYQA